MAFVRMLFCAHALDYHGDEKMAPGSFLLDMLTVFFLPKVFCVPGRKFVDLDAS